MSGHSKWSQIKHKKSLTDAKRGKIFSKIARMITVAAREKGPNPDMNPQLRVTVEKARMANMPSDNIDKAIKKGSGAAEGARLQNVLYEAYGPGGAAILIEGITDNKNRTSNEIKHILSVYRGKMANPGSVLWMFKKAALFAVQNPKSALYEDFELSLIDLGADNITEDKDTTYIESPPEKEDVIKKFLLKNGVKIKSFSLGWAPATTVKISDKDDSDLEKLYQALLDQDDTQEVYTNTE